MGGRTYDAALRRFARAVPMPMAARALDTHPLD
jgi:hypothetical protein